MESSIVSFWGKSRYWWAILLAGILMIPCGIWFILSPMAGYATISLMLGWALILLGVLQLVVAGDISRKEHSWGWWLAGGIFDILIGFVLVGNLFLSEIILPYFFAFAFLYRAVKNIVAGATPVQKRRHGWLYFVNGIVLLIPVILFFFAPFMATFTIIYMCAFVFIYWGVVLIAFSIDLKPCKTKI